MAATRGTGRERVNVFEVDGTYLFKHYFDGAAVFQRLESYYNNQQYRFEVPPGRFPELREFLDVHGYELTVVDGVEEFVVVVEKYTAHPDDIFKASVMQRAADGYNHFLLTDQPAVERAVAGGAVRLTETALENPF